MVKKRAESLIDPGDINWKTQMMNIESCKENGNKRMVLWPPTLEPCL
jgi:hypothetical protein